MTESTVSSSPNLSYKNKPTWRPIYGIRNRNQKMLFFIAGYNGGPLVESHLLRNGWVRIFDKNTDDFNLKWTETLHQINFYRVRPNQLVNHIPNCGILTNKMGLLLSLRGYERYCKSIEKLNPLHMDDFIPKTYIVDDINERNEFYRQFRENDIWISKPVGANQGKGITLIRNLTKFKSELTEKDPNNRNMWSMQTKIVQRYITNPLLIYQKKFDLRCYMLIASTIPYLVLFCPGYVRLSMNVYSNTDENLITHLTNQFIQKKSPRYNQCKEDTVMSMSAFNNYFNENCKELSNFKLNWVENELVDKMKTIILHVFKSIKERLANSTAYFEVYGLDFMIDDNLKLWLIEANSNPSMSTQCSVLKQIIPQMVEEALTIVLECFDKNTKLNRPLLPLENIRNFQVIYAENFDMSKTRRNIATTYKAWSMPRFYFTPSIGSSSNLNLQSDTHSDSSSMMVGGVSSVGGQSSSAITSTATAVASGSTITQSVTPTMHKKRSYPFSTPHNRGVPTGPEHWYDRYKDAKRQSFANISLSEKLSAEVIQSRPILSSVQYQTGPAGHLMRSMGGMEPMDHLAGDVRYVSRSVQTSPIPPGTKLAPLLSCISPQPLVTESTQVKLRELAKQ